MTLNTYNKKRSFTETSEPIGTKKSKETGVLHFVIQKHDARRLHYDFRLEYKGVLLSWAIPKEPSEDSSVKRLAIEVEDHPLEYRHFQGTIPEGNYGAGTVEIWDKGTYTSRGESTREGIEKAIAAGLKKGHVEFTLQGERLQGDFDLIKLKNSEKGNEWLFIKRSSGTIAPTKSSKSIKEKVSAFTNESKIYYPDEKITKGDVLDYYNKIAPYILPYLKDRPVVMRRYPEGIDGVSFVQKDLATHPEWIKTFPIQHEGKVVNYLDAKNVKSLQYAVNLGSIEIHAFNTPYSDLDHPTFCVIDLDPEKIGFDAVIETAQTVHEILETAGVPSYCKTSGATGLHIYIPLHGKYSIEQSQQFAKLVAYLAHQKLPKITSIERLPAKRQKKVYLDFGQNNFGQTLVCPYSLRAKKGAPVSTPLEWKEVKAGLDPLKFNIKTIFKRLQSKGDLFKPVLGKGADLTKALKKLESL